MWTILRQRARQIRDEAHLTRRVAAAISLSEQRAGLLDDAHGLEAEADRLDRQAADLEAGAPPPR